MANLKRFSTCILKHWDGNTWNSFNIVQELIESGRWPDSLRGEPNPAGLWMTTNVTMLDLEDDNQAHAISKIDIRSACTASYAYMYMLLNANLCRKVQNA